MEQLLIGFRRLAHRKVVKLEFQTMCPSDVHSKAGLSALLNGRWRILYDVKDGYNFHSGGKNVYREVMDNLLDGCDFYFKRSCSASFNANLKTPEKVLPLGLNIGYTVHSTRNSIKFVLKRLLRIAGGPTLPEDIESLPIFDTRPTAIFFTRMWDPDDVGDFRDENIHKIQKQRIKINNMRAACIRACRYALGPQFIGGFSDSPSTRRQFPDCVLQDTTSTLRSDYLQLMKRAAIGISTAGLHDSIGWKFTEYIAAAKAIVSEPLSYTVPGPLEKGRNYLEFNSPDSCVEAVSRLLKDENLRFQMMRSNFDYYRSYVEPSQLVLNSLLTVLERVGSADAKSSPFS